MEARRLSFQLAIGAGQRRDVFKRASSRRAAAAVRRRAEDGSEEARRALLAAPQASEDGAEEARRALFRQAASGAGAKVEEAAEPRPAQVGIRLGWPELRAAVSEHALASAAQPAQGKAEPQRHYRRLGPVPAASSDVKRKRALAARRADPVRLRRLVYQRCACVARSCFTQFEASLEDLQQFIAELAALPKAVQDAVVRPLWQCSN